MSKEKSLLKMEYAKSLGMKIDKKITHFKNAQLEIKGGVSALAQLAGIFTKRHQDSLADEKKVDKENISYVEVIALIKNASNNLEKQIYGAVNKVEALESVMDDVEQDFKAEENKLRGYSLAEEKPEIVEQHRPIGIKPVPLKKIKGTHGAHESPN